MQRNPRDHGRRHDSADICSGIKNACRQRPFFLGKPFGNGFERRGKVARFADAQTKTTRPNQEQSVPTRERQRQSTIRPGKSYILFWSRSVNEHPARGIQWRSESKGPGYKTVMLIGPPQFRPATVGAGLPAQPVDASNRCGKKYQRTKSTQR